MSPATLLIVGVGNAFRGDDGVGPAVVGLLRDRLKGAQLNCLTIQDAVEPLSLIETWNGASAVVLIDAMCSGATPGSIRRFEAGDGKFPPTGLRASTHGLDVFDVIELARSLSKLPPTVIVYGVEGRAFEVGQPLSAEVAAAFDSVTKRVEEDVRSILRGWESSRVELEVRD